MKLKRLTTAALALMLIFSVLGIHALAEESEAAVFHVDSLNGTRWADYICVYKGLLHTGQNEWGENVVVNSEGVVIEKIPGADERGKDLPIPEGGMVVSGTGDIGKEMYASAEIGDRCLFDEYSMRVYFSKGEIDPFYEVTLRVTGYNDVRWSDTVIVYDEAGKTTGTNPYGYEVCVGSDGYVIAVGGNDNLVPEGGYVVSATELADIDTLKMYFTVGAKCILKKDSVTAVYSESELVRTAESELDILKSKLEAAKAQYKLIDYAAVEEAIANIEIGGINTLEERNAVIAQMREIYPMLVESRTVETRSVWYTATESNAKKIKETVAEMKAAGINELVLSSNSQKGTIIPIDTDVIPFKRDPAARRIDILQTYIDECRANDISIVVLVPVMGGSFAENHPEWFDVTNTGEEREEIFFSPANAEYRKAFFDYVSYILTNYDVDGLQLDYIRYPEFHNNVDAGYDEATIKLFEEKTGNGEDVVREIGKQLSAHPQWNAWWSFKTELINGWVKDLYALASELRPDVYVTAAVAANNGVRTYCQDPATWIKNGYIDGVYVMSYSEEINEASTLHRIDERGDGSYLVMGCGAYLSISNLSLIEQTDSSASLGADGTGYFEWGAVKDHRYTDIFASSLFKESAIPFTADVDEVVGRLVATTKARVALYCQTADEATVDALDAIMASLPDEGTSLESLNTAKDEIYKLLGENDAKHLSEDLDTATRALNMKKDDFEFVKPEPEESSDEASSDTLSGESEESAVDEGKSSLVIPIVIAVIAVAVIIAAATVVIKRKKK